MSRNLPAWFFGPAEDAVRAVMERTPRTVLHHDPPRSRKWLRKRAVAAVRAACPTDPVTVIRTTSLSWHGRLARLLCWAGIHGPEELRYLPQTARLWRVCRRCHRTVSLRVLS